MSPFQSEWSGSPLLLGHFQVWNQRETHWQGLLCLGISKPGPEQTPRWPVPSGARLTEAEEPAWWLCPPLRTQPAPASSPARQLGQELQFVISARSLLGLTGAWMCLLSLATVGLSSVLSILKLLYLSVREVPSSQLRWESFELCGSEYTRSQKIKETILFKGEKKRWL